MLYSYGSYYWRDSSKGSGANGMQDVYEAVMDATAAEWLDPDLKPVPFWDTVRALSGINAQYDVVMLPDGDFRPDDTPADLLDGYPLVVVPDCPILTGNQQQILLDYAKRGGKILVTGSLAEGTALAEELNETGNAVFVPVNGNKAQDVPRFMAAFEPLYAGCAPLECRMEKIGVQRYDNNGKTWIHVLNYRYDDLSDHVLPIEKLEMTVRDVDRKQMQILVPDGETVPTYGIRGEDGITKVTLYGAGLYTVIAFG